MRALFATAVACLTLAACSQADPLPRGMAERLTAPADVFTIAVPAGWRDLGRHDSQETSGPAGFHTWSLGPDGGVPVRTNPPGTIPNPPPGFGMAALRVGWSDDLNPPGISGTEVNTAPVTIAGQAVPTRSDGSTSLVASFEHQVAGHTEQFFASCPYEVPRDTCAAVVQSWRWESPGSSHVLPALVGAGAAAALAGGLTLLGVRRRRRSPAS